MRQTAGTFVVEHAAAARVLRGARGDLADSLIHEIGKGAGMRQDGDV